jgi:uncharacterized protein YbjQ (UPF0145 family)
MNTANDGSIRIVTTEGIADAEIASTVGVVIGIAVRTRGIGGNIMAGLEAAGGDSAVDEFRADLVAIRQEALARMGRAAQELGATAVVGARFDAADVGREMVEIVAYGTAVILQDRAS